MPKSQEGEKYRVTYNGTVKIYPILLLKTQAYLGNMHQEVNKYND